MSGALQPKNATTSSRRALVSATHKRLAQRLKLPVEDVDSVIRLVQSKLDASVVRYLREDTREA